jgi:hypothetical protein
MKLVYYYKKNQTKYCKAIICSIKTLNDKLMKIKGPIENLHLNIKKKHDISDSDLEFKIYTYNKINGTFYISQDSPSDIILQEETRSHIEKILT